MAREENEEIDQGVLVIFWDRIVKWATEKYVEGE